MSALKAIKISSLAEFARCKSKRDPVRQRQRDLSFLEKERIARDRKDGFHQIRCSPTKIPTYFYPRQVTIHEAKQTKRNEIRPSTSIPPLSADNRWYQRWFIRTWWHDAETLLNFSKKRAERPPMTAINNSSGRIERIFNRQSYLSLSEREPLKKKHSRRSRCGSRRYGP